MKSINCIHDYFSTIYYQESYFLIILDFFFKVKTRILQVKTRRPPAPAVLPLDFSLQTTQLYPLPFQQRLSSRMAKTNGPSSLKASLSNPP